MILGRRRRRERGGGDRDRVAGWGGEGKGGEAGHMNGEQVSYNYLSD